MPESISSRKITVLEGERFAVCGIEFTAVKHGVLDLSDSSWPETFAMLIGKYICELPDTILCHLHEPYRSQARRSKRNFRIPTNPVARPAGAPAVGDEYRDHPVLPAPKTVVDSIQDQIKGLV